MKLRHHTIRWQDLIFLSFRRFAAECLPGRSASHLVAAQSAADCVPTQSVGTRKRMKLNHERSDIKIPRLGVVDDQGGSGLLGDELVLLRQFHADPSRTEEFEEFCLILQARAGRVAEAVAGAPVVLAEQLFDLGTVGSGDAEFSPYL